MKELKTYELNQIYGGAGLTGAALKAIAIIAGIIFGIGVFDGYVRPLRCR